MSAPNNPDEPEKRADDEVLDMTGPDDAKKPSDLTPEEQEVIDQAEEKAEYGAARAARHVYRVRLGPRGLG